MRPSSPPRSMNRVTVSGVVRNTAGTPVEGALVIAQLVSEQVPEPTPGEDRGKCRGGLWAQRESVSSVTGQFDIPFASPGPAVDACLVLTVYAPDTGLKDTTVSGWRFRFEVPHASELPNVHVDVALTPIDRPRRGALPSPQVDRTEYTAAYVGGEGQARTYAFTIIARYENPTADTLYISRCLPRDRTPEYGVEAIDDATAESAYDPVWACVGHGFPIVVAPHAARVDTLRIEGPNVFDGKTIEPLGNLEGEFRLIYTVGSCGLGCARCGKPRCQTLPVERRSPAFRVRVAR